MVAIIFPWIIIFADDNPVGGFAAMAMQATLIGWIPATIWAWKIVHRPEVPETIIAPDANKPKKSNKTSIKR